MPRALRAMGGSRTMPAMRSLRSALALFAALCASWSTVVTLPVAEAAEVRVLSAAVLKPALNELAPAFERSTGHTLKITYESAGVVRTRVQDGEAADVAIIQKPVVEALAKQGKIVPASVAVLARSGVAVAVPAGTPKPDVGSVDALKRALLTAPSVSYPDPGLGHASGIHFRP